MNLAEGRAGSLGWKLSAGKGGWRVLTLEGDIDENAELEQLMPQLDGPVEIDLAGVQRINSCGVREWVHFVRYAEHSRLRFLRCSPAVVNQINAISNFRGNAEVVSILAPYVCGGCGADELRVLVVAAHFPKAPRNVDPPLAPCEHCGDVMSLDELPDRYLTFLLELDHA